MINIAIHAEDKVMVAIGARIIRDFGDKFHPISDPLLHSGAGNIEKLIPNFNHAAHYGNVRLVLMDMDSLAFPQDKKSCPASKIRAMLSNKEKSPNLLLRIAVYEAESWLMADWVAFKAFFKLSGDRPEVDELMNAKSAAKEMIKRGNPNKNLRFERLRYQFIEEKWQPQRAAEHSKSLRKTLDRLQAFSD